MKQISCDQLTQDTSENRDIQEMYLKTTYNPIVYRHVYVILFGIYIYVLHPLALRVKVRHYFYSIFHPRDIQSPAIIYVAIFQIDKSRYS